MWVSGKMIKEQDMVNKIGPMETFILVSGQIIKNLGRVYSHRLKEMSIKDIM